MAIRQEHLENAQNPSGAEDVAASLTSTEQTVIDTPKAEGTATENTITENESQPVETVQNDGGNSDGGKNASVESPFANPAPEKKRRSGLVKLGGIAAAVAVVAGGAFALGKSSGNEAAESQATPVITEDASEDTETPAVDTEVSQEEVTQTETDEAEEQTEPSNTDVSGEIEIPEGYMDVGNGFIIPQLRTERIVTQPELVETNDVQNALDQIANNISYATNTGDFDALEYAYMSSNSELGAQSRGEHENAVILDEQHGFPDFFYHNQFVPVEGSPQTLNPEDGSITVETRIAQVGFDMGDVEEYIFWQTQIADVTLRQKEVEVDGKTLNIWVISEIDNQTFSDFYSEYSVITPPTSS